MKTESILPKPIVSALWLNEHFLDENLIILDATIKKVGTTSEVNGVKKQIKNARFFDLKNVFSDTESPYPSTFPSKEKFEEEAQNLGINIDSKIVVYDDLGIYVSARVWWMFTCMGFKEVAVLDGGFPAWKNADFSIDNQVNTVFKKGNFIADYNPKSISYTKDVLEASLQKEKLIVDARSSGRFFATAPEPRDDIRGGHIPNSVSLPYTSLQSEGKMISPKEIEALFKKVNPTEKELIFSCGSGITACVLALGATLTGNNKYSVYDGSWTEWGSNLKLPITTKKTKMNWTKNEFKAYVLLYAAHSNYVEADEERDYILSKVSEEVFNGIHTEIVHDNDFQSMEKIQNYLAENKYSQEDKDQLLKDIKNVFFVDGSVDVLERNVFLFLKKILK